MSFFPKGVSKLFYKLYIITIFHIFLFEKSNTQTIISQINDIINRYDNSSSIKIDKNELNSYKSACENILYLGINNEKNDHKYCTVAPRDEDNIKRCCLIQWEKKQNDEATNKQKRCAYLTDGKKPLKELKNQLKSLGFDKLKIKCACKYINSINVFLILLSVIIL